MSGSFHAAEPLAMNMRQPETEQARLIDGNMVSSKGVVPLESEKGTKNGGKPPLMQTDFSSGENNVFANTDRQAQDREKDIHALGGGIPSFRELMGDRMQNGVTAYHDLASNKTHGHGENKLGVSRTEYGDLRAGTRNNGRMPRYKGWGPMIRGQ